MSWIHLQPTCRRFSLRPHVFQSAMAWTAFDDYVFTNTGSAYKRPLATQPMNAMLVDMIAPQKFMVSLFKIDQIRSNHRHIQSHVQRGKAPNSQLLHRKRRLPLLCAFRGRVVKLAKAPSHFQCQQHDSAIIYACFSNDSPKPQVLSWAHVHAVCPKCEQGVMLAQLGSP